jgi:hypothetical protein
MEMPWIVDVDEVDEEATRQVSCKSTLRTQARQAGLVTFHLHKISGAALNYRRWCSSLMVSVVVVSCRLLTLLWNSSIISIVTAHRGQDRITRWRDSSRYGPPVQVNSVGGMGSTCH